jgi:hypothetical protein
MSSFPDGHRGKPLLPAARSNRRIAGTHQQKDAAVQDNDILAQRLDDGSYRIRRYRASDGRLIPIDGHDAIYTEEEMYRRFDQLRSTGDTYVSERPGIARLIGPEHG